MRNIYSFIKLVAFSATLLIAAVQLTEAVLGARCYRNSQCDVAKNEQCGNNLGFEPACNEGFCECKPCYTKDKFGNCIKKRYITQLGAYCDHAVEEVISIPKAQCIDNIVQCHFSTFRDGNTCQTNLTCDSRIHGYPGQFCPTGTVCSRDNRCTCYDGTKWDSTKDICVPKEFGDSCGYDSDCNYDDSGREGEYNLLGYIPSGQARCQDGKCTCPDFGYKYTRVGYIDESNNFKQKTICVPSSVNINNRAGQCMIDPIRGSAFVSRVCSADKICYRCALDNAFVMEGTCRNVLEPPFDDIFRCIGESVMLAKPSTSTESSLPPDGSSSASNPNSASGSPSNDASSTPFDSKSDNSRISSTTDYSNVTSDSQVASDSTTSGTIPMKSLSVLSIFVPLYSFYSCTL